jgi:hypothetical protein
MAWYELELLGIQAVQAGEPGKRQKNVNRLPSGQGLRAKGSAFFARSVVFFKVHYITLHGGIAWQKSDYRKASR